MEVRQLFALARRWIWLLILSIATGAAIAFLFALVVPKTYESTSTLLVGQPFTATTDTLAASQLQAQTYAELATLRPMLQKVIGAVGLEETPNELAGQVFVRASRTSILLTITVLNTKADTAAAIANAVAAELIALSSDPETNPGPTNLTVVESAEPAAAPSFPKVTLITALGGAGGLLVAVGVIAVVMRGARGARRVEGEQEPVRWATER